MLGDRLLIPPGVHHGVSHPSTHDINITDHDPGAWCTANVTGDIYNRYCSDVNGTTQCDDYFLNNEVVYKHAIPGMFSGNFNSELSSLQSFCCCYNTWYDAETTITTEIACCFFYFAHV